MLGCVTPMGEQSGNVGKMAPQVAGWAETVSGVQMDRYCGSGLESVNSAAQNIMSGWSQLMVAGGLESMSRTPMTGTGGVLFRDPEYVMGQTSIQQGIGADLVATLDGFSREDVDSYSLESQRRAAAAQESGYFDRSVVPVKDRNGMTILEKDDYLRPSTTTESLASLRPAFEPLGEMGADELLLSKYSEVEKINHVHTAGNSSGIVDGASTVLIGSEQVGIDLGLTPRARIISGASIATDPSIMVTGAVPSAIKCLKIAGMDKSDIDLWEVNEAFAAVPMRYMNEMNIDHEIFNVNGGAIALGHPLGATGAMLLGTVLDELERRNLKRALISLCAAGGMGVSTIIERV